VILFAVYDKCKLRVFENKMLRTTFEPKRNEVTVEWTA
jgi:hypothetical protein